jgi:NAD(P)-dependent dehydrogenase (short-subunit alcohol dehydrogenase family)
MPIYSELRGRTVLITGGANGIGAAMVRAFHGQGARVSFCDTDTIAATRLVRELGRDVDFHKVDLRKEREIKQWISRVAAQLKTVGVLVNNAAADPRIPLEQTTSKAWDDLFTRNLRAFFLTSREASKWMARGSSIINFSSITFHTAPAPMTAYVSTKAGIIGFTRSLARELGSRRIRVNVISPGWIMTERQLKQFVTPAVKRLIHSSQCIPDLIQPRDIAEIALFLASDASTALTGQEILADRGWSFS